MTDLANVIRSDWKQFRVSFPFSLRSTRECVCVSFVTCVLHPRATSTRFEVINRISVAAAECVSVWTSPVRLSDDETSPFRGTEVARVFPLKLEILPRTNYDTTEIFRVTCTGISPQKFLRTPTWIPTTSKTFDRQAQVGAQFPLCI